LPARNRKDKRGWKKQRKCFRDGEGRPQDLKKPAARTTKGVADKDVNKIKEAIQQSLSHPKGGL